jgi:hypothetical protein
MAFDKRDYALDVFYPEKESKMTEHMNDVTLQTIDNFDSFRETSDQNDYIYNLLEIMKTYVSENGLCLLEKCTAQQLSYLLMSSNILPQ